MSEQTDVLLLRLEGPLQSWGEAGRWSVRDTRLEPTKSGVVGMLAACLGWGPADDALIVQLAAALRMGVRIDRPGRVVRDYHTLCGGVLSAEGKIKITQSTGEPETVPSERYYLADACFLVGLEGQTTVVDRLEAALHHPVWPPFLGRKSCVPSAPLYPALPTYPSQWRGAALEDVLARFPSLDRETPTEPALAIIEVSAGHQAQGEFVQVRRDVPLSLVTRRFAHRYVRETQLAVEPSS